MTSIFQIDWITVDIIIIILLILLLFGVKVFKSTHRWRYSFSNQALEHICFTKKVKNQKKNKILTKKWCLTTNLSYKNNYSNLPLILILKTTDKRKLTRTFTEGLCSYGFNVIEIKTKIRHIPNNGTSRNIFINEWKSLISTILDDFKLKEVVKKPNFVLIDYSKSITCSRLFLSDSDIMGVILINPKLSRRDSSDYQEIFRNNLVNTQIFPIFSRKSIFVFKNKHLKRFIKEAISQEDNNLKYGTIEKATYSFKYYETIVLGMIIDIIENELPKSEI
ncbi:MAG: hypothetical protein ACFE9C_04180 [Candidatus Hodarchaeota archaeon]